jgi:hypothetical protein
MPATITNPVFKQPLNRDQKVWRYMDFAKYVDLLSRRALYFSRPEYFGDPFEGAFGPANLEFRKALAAGGNVPHDVVEQLIGMRRGARQWMFINCWHASDVESAAMWKIYSTSHAAIAIQSTYRRLASVLPKRVNLGVVNYVDYDTEQIAELSVFAPFMHKRRSFSYENEVRGVIFTPPTLNAQKLAKSVNTETGRLVKVNLQKLIERVYVAPTAPAWFLDLVTSVSARYDLADVDVQRSKLDDSPVF